MRVWVCLLRAVNLGARNKVAMPRLRQALASAGTVHAVCLDAAPDPARVAATIAEDWNADRLEINGREAWIQYATSMHGSRLPHATLFGRLGADGTAGNWRTMSAIARILDERHC